MSTKVCSGATLKCNCGIGTSNLEVLPINKVMLGGKSAANVADCKPGLNIANFPLCNSKANPLVAQAIAASQGSVTVAPCQFAPAGQWSGGCKKVKIAGAAALTKDAKLKCAFNGQIEIVEPGQSSVSAE